MTCISFSPFQGKYNKPCFNHVEVYGNTPKRRDHLNMHDPIVCMYQALNQSGKEADLTILVFWAVLTYIFTFSHK